MLNRTNDSTAAVKAVCAIIFMVFIVTYVYSFQCDLLAMTQYVWAEGQTHYERVIGTVTITLILSILTLVIRIFVRLPQRAFSLVFFPAFLLLGLLTAVNVNGACVTTSQSWLIAFPLMVIAYIIVVGQLCSFQPFMTPLRSTSFLSHPWWTNILLMVMMMMMTYSMGNTDRTLHTRLKVERYCQMRDWDKALEVGFPQYDNDSSLTMLRALALANTGQLGEKLFTYNVTGGSKALMPQPDKSVTFLLGTDKVLWRTTGVVPYDRTEGIVDYLKREIRRGTVTPVAGDYLLCAYLLDRDLQSFVKALPLFYNVGDSMPAHYREAYLLYCERYKQRDTLIAQSMRADYADFLDVMRTNRAPVVRDAAIRDAYFGTYWYYYYKRRD